MAGIVSENIEAITESDRIIYGYAERFIIDERAGKVTVSPLSTLNIVGQNLCPSRSFPHAARGRILLIRATRPTPNDRPHGRDVGKPQKWGAALPPDVPHYW
jgi:hypothetical protein